MHQNQTEQKKKRIVDATQAGKRLSSHISSEIHTMKSSAVQTTTSKSDLQNQSIIFCPKRDGLQMGMHDSLLSFMHCSQSACLLAEQAVCQHSKHSSEGSPPGIGDGAGLGVGTGVGAGDGGGVGTGDGEGE